MYFTQEDFKRIEEYLRRRTIKDTEFPTVEPINGSEYVPIIQDSKNRVIALDSLSKQLADIRSNPDFYNVSLSSNMNLSLEEAIKLVPNEMKKLGLVITFCNNGEWNIYQFHGSTLDQWNNKEYWNTIKAEGGGDSLCFAYLIVEGDMHLYMTHTELAEGTFDLDSNNHIHFVI